MFLVCIFGLTLFLLSSSATNGLSNDDASWTSLSASTTKCSAESCDELVILGILNGFFAPNTTIPSPNRFVPRTSQGTNPDDKQCLLKAAQVMLNAISENGNILPSYQLSLRFYDEDISNVFAPRIASDFFHSLEANLSLTKRYISPLFFGPLQGCSAAALTAIQNIAFERITGFYNFNLFKPAFCPNNLPAQIYIPRSSTRIQPHSVANAAALTFVQSPFTKWRQIGIIADSFTLDRQGIQAIKVSQQLLAGNGIEIVFFDVGNDYLEIFTKMKLSRARIAVLASDYVANWDCADVLCSAHMAGIRAPKYVLIFTSFYCFPVARRAVVTNPPNVDGRTYHICDNAILQEQLLISIFSEQSMQLTFVTIGRQLANYISEDSQAKINNIISDSQLWGKLLPFCKNTTANVLSFRNAFLSTVLTLNLTEQRLSNLTLRNFRQSPELVADAITGAATELSFWGTDADEWINDTVRAMVFQLDPRTDNSDASLMAYITPYNRSNNRLIMDFDKHEFEVHGPHFWQTRDGNPPKDLSTVEHRRDDQLPIILAISLLSAVLTLVQGAICKKKPKLSTTVYFDFKNNQILIIGCFLLNLSSFLISIGNSYFLQQLCYFRLFFPCFGLALINGMLLARILAMPTFSSLNRYLSQKRRNVVSFSLPAFELDREKKLARLTIWVRKVFLGISIGHFVVLIVWLAADPVVMKAKVLHEDDPLYDSDEDSYYDVTIQWCESKSQLYFLAILTAVHILALLLASMLAVSLKQKLKFVRKRFQLEVLTVRVAVINSASLMLFSVLVILVTPFSYQITAFNACLLVYSASTSVIVYLPLWRHYFKRDLQVSVTSSSR